METAAAGRAGDGARGRARPPAERDANAPRAAAGEARARSRGGARAAATLDAAPGPVPAMRRPSVADEFQDDALDAAMLDFDIDALVERAASVLLSGVADAVVAGDDGCRRAELKTAGVGPSSPAQTALYVAMVSASAALVAPRDAGLLVYAGDRRVGAAPLDVRGRRVSRYELVRFRR
ncbi:single-stranded DNA-dependent ATPase [Aureococcus anophagefferens]|nr:single-stranded DNA-dependent ATPase [Aureococcus anophagefferens]